MDKDDPTAKFQLALPFTLLPVSPQLAALHAVRTRVGPDSPFCSRCGSLSTDGDVRVFRQKKPRKPRLLRRTCRVCGSVIDTPITSPNVRAFPPARKATTQTPETHAPTPTPAEPITMFPTNPPQSKETKRAKPRPKKRAGLEEMLSRNRQRQQEAKATQSTTLATFLQGL